nr:efflux transporter outer membrane subunit [uncultured Desulfuromonas sp.]
MKNNLITLITALVLTGGLSGCAGFHGIDSTATMRNAPQSLSTGQLASGPWSDRDWWHLFNDPQLNALMTEALDNSPTLKEAQARIRRALALAGQVRSGYGPQVALQGETIYQRFTENGSVGEKYAGDTDSANRLGFNLAYDLDLWGRKKAAYRAALGTAKAAEVEAQAVKLTLTCAIAETYSQLRRVTTQKELYTQRLEQDEQIRELRRLRADAGLEPEDDGRRVANKNALTRVTIALLTEQQTLLQHRLGTLAGAGPQRGLALNAPPAASLAPPTLPSTIPAQLIGRRPDVVAQLWRIDALTHGIASAKAAFYPDVNLSAFAGFDAIGLENLLESGSRVYGVGPALTLPLFTSGRLQSALAAENAAYDGAVEHYNALILTAVHEVADAVTSWQASTRRLDDREEALEQLTALHHLAELHYANGLSGRIPVLDAQTRILDEQSAQAELRQRRELALLALIRALGGGLTPQPPASTSQQKSTKEPLAKSETFKG